MQKSNISNSVIRRLPRYYRFLGRAAQPGYSEDPPPVSCRRKCGLQLRSIRSGSQLLRRIRSAGLRLQRGGASTSDRAYPRSRHRHDKIILIGAGNLGRAITVHIGFQKYGYELAGIFDSNISLENIEISGIKIMHTNRLAEFCKENHPKMAVLCIPKSGAKEMVQKLLDLGVNAFWNFSHYDIHYDHPEAAVENVHLTDSLMTLSYAARRA